MIRRRYGLMWLTYELGDRSLIFEVEVKVKVKVKVEAHYEEYL